MNGNMFSASKVGMDHQFKLNLKLANQDRAWQERMANSAHQREIADLKKAGLNPALTLTGGNGAATPSGSNTSVSDGAGYFSALANLAAAQETASATKYAADKSYESVVYSTDNPTPNTPTGFGAWILSKTIDSLDKKNEKMDFNLDPNSARKALNQKKAVQSGKKGASYKAPTNKSAVRYRKLEAKKKGYTDIDALLKELMK